MAGRTKYASGARKPTGGTVTSPTVTIGGGDLDPTGRATRVQTAVMLQRCLANPTA